MTRSKKTKREALQEQMEAAIQEAHGVRAGNVDARKKYRDDPFLQAKIKKELIADIHRVKDHELNNSMISPVSRETYRKLGYWPEIVVQDIFGGTWNEALRAAGLMYTRTQQRTLHRASLLHHHQQIQKFAEDEVLPHVGLYDTTDTNGIIRVLIGSDFHSWFTDPLALRVFLDTVSMVIAPLGKRGRIVLNGDIFDFPTISRHRQMPGHFHLNLHQEREWGREQILAQVRERAPEATIDFVIGNHEYRLVTYIADKASSFAGLPELNFESFLGIHDYNLNLVCRSSFLAPTAAARKKDVRDNWIVIGDCYVATHGTSYAKVAAMVEMDGPFKMSGTSGHTHRPMIVHGASLGTGSINWMSTPMMAGFAVGKDYVSTPSQWNMGFGLATINPKTKQVSQQIVQVHEEWAEFGGRIWNATKEDRDRRNEQWAV